MSELVEGKSPFTGAQTDVRAWQRKGAPFRDKQTDRVKWHYGHFESDGPRVSVCHCVSGVDNESALSASMCVTECG
jgi:hypothetical protein